MVIAHSNKAGQFSKKNAVTEAKRSFTIATTIGLLVIGFLGGLIGFTIGRPLALVYGVIALAVVGGCGWWISRWTDAYMEKASRRRLGFLRGGQAEAFTSILLRTQLDDDYHLFDNLMLDANSDIDHIVIGPGGFFVISTKSQRGLFQCSDASHAGKPTFNNSTTDWCRDVTTQDMRLKDQLAVLEPARQPWIQTILSLPFAAITPANGQCGPTWVVNEDSLTDAIEERSDRRNRLNKSDVQHWVAAVEKLRAHRQPTRA